MKYSRYFIPTKKHFSEKQPYIVFWRLNDEKDYTTVKFSDNCIVCAITYTLDLKICGDNGLMKNAY